MPPPRPPVRGPPSELENTLPKAEAAARALGVDVLVCVEGPLEGEQFPLRKAVLLVGRSDGCDVVLGDPSVSRRHVQLRRNAQGWWVSDVGSGNGSELGGRPLKGEQPFLPGERLTLGDTRLELLLATPPSVNPSPNPPPEPIAPAQLPPPTQANPPSVAELETRVPTRRHLDSGPSQTAVLQGRRGGVAKVDEAPPRPGLGGRRAERPRRARGPGTALAQRRRRWVFLTLGLLPLAVLTGLWVKGRREEAAREAIRRTAESRFQTGKNLLRQGKWEASEAAFAAVRAADPLYPVDDFIRRAQTERQNQLQLEQAASALQAGRLAEAAQALQRTTPPTQQQERLTALRDQLGRQADDRAFEAHRALDRGDEDSASRLAHEVLAALPEHRGARAALERAATPPQEPPPPTAPKPKERRKRRR